MDCAHTYSTDYIVQRYGLYTYESVKDLDILLDAEFYVCSNCRRLIHWGTKKAGDKLIHGTRVVKTQRIKNLADLRNAQLNFRLSDFQLIKGFD